VPAEPPETGTWFAGRNGVHHAHAIAVLTATATGISSIVVFGDPGLFTRFGLPPTHRPSRT
jgi:RNA polymerase sigma-70 factor, ECF subfamily